ncbi:MAG: preprotein translocase subunit SecE [Clostridiales bacterium]|jgi:preprotein translocase subunit SecE|nr:preprotein translocase subunit SecE [Eubacteriales bacterium]MDH7566431.1 preprotein translocase subunit SecE [Clostridiales bacterium]
MADVAKTSKFNNFVKNTTRFFKEIKSELKKVIWPDRNQLINNTVTVLMVCLLIGAVIWISDFALTKLSELVFIR